MNERYSNIVAKLFFKAFDIIENNKLNNADIWDFSHVLFHICYQTKRERKYLFHIVIIMYYLNWKLLSGFFAGTKY